MPGSSGAQNGKGAENDPNYVSRPLLDCVPVFHKIITPAYLLYRSGPVAFYYSEIYSLFYDSGHTVTSSLLTLFVSFVTGSTFIIFVLAGGGGKIIVTPM